MENSLVKQKLDLLSQAGMAGITDDLTAKVEKSWNGMPDDIKQVLGESFILPMALTTMGGGEFDEITEEWTPGSDEVFTFDVEIYDTSQMYTNFLKGLSAISKGEFSITEIEEKIEGTDSLEGTTTQAVRFCLNGQSYQYTGEFLEDWFDENFMEYMKEILAKVQSKKELFVTSDGGQEYIIFYRTKEWADKFAQVTGTTWE